MKAIQAVRHGSFDALKFVDLPDPEPGDGDVLVRVTAAGVTPLDRTVLMGALPTAKVPPLVLGNEGAGVVVRDRSGRFQTGERVLFFAGPGGVARDGAYAERALVPAGLLTRLPEAIPDELAAGLPVAYLSGFLALRQAGFTAGQSVFAPGVGGSVGNATLKIAKALGATQLLSTAGSAAKRKVADADASLDGVKVIDLSSESAAHGLARLMPTGVDVVVDAVGGSLTGQAVGGLARGGRAVVMGYVAGTRTEIAITDLVWRRATLSGFSLFAASEQQQADAYATLLPLIADGRIAPAQDRIFPLEHAAEALRHLTEDRPFGKVVLTMN